MTRLSEILEKTFMAGLGIAAADDIRPEDKDRAILNTQKHYVFKAEDAINAYIAENYVNKRAVDAEVVEALIAQEEEMKESFAKNLAEIIGEDEPLVPADPMQKRSLEIRRNELRAEQRKRAGL